MKIKIKLQTEKIDDFELDPYEAYCTMPIVVGDKMIIGNFVNFVYLMNETIETLPIELKKILEEKQTKAFYLKESLLTITGLTAYNIDIGNSEEKNIYSEKIYENFDEEKKIFYFLTYCDFPYEGMEIYFQTKGDVFLEFDLKDVFFVENGDFTEWRKIHKQKSEEIERKNGKKHTNYLKKIHKKQMEV